MSFDLKTTVLIIAAFTLGAVISHVSDAQAADTMPIECKTVGNGAQAKWQQTMTTWVAEGRTHFVNNPAGICAW